MIDSSFSDESNLSLGHIAPEQNLLRDISLLELSLGIEIENLNPKEKKWLTLI